MIKKVVIVLIAAGALAAAGRYFPVDFLRPTIERALERGLGRKVEIGSVHLNAIGSPGFTIEDVTIHEDPRAGIEPAAYSTSVNVGVRLPSLLLGQLEFSSVSLGDASFNLVRTSSGVWSLQYLFGGGSEGVPAVRMPPIKMRGGRLNLKYGDTKSVFFFDDADLDVETASNGSVSFRFGGSPARTDRSAREFGRLYLKGTWTTVGDPKLSCDVELERSAVDEVAKIVDPEGLGMSGTLAIRAQLSGPPDRLSVTGTLHAEDLRRSDLLPMKGAWDVNYRGSLALHRERMDLESVGVPVSLRLQVESLLSGPRIDATADLTGLPLAQGLDAMRRLGLSLVEGVTADGVAPNGNAAGNSISGGVSYSYDTGYLARLQFEGPAAAGAVQYQSEEWSGELAVANLSVPLDGLADPMKLESGVLALAGSKATLKKLKAGIGKTAFTGEFVWDREAETPFRFRTVVPEASGEEVVRVLTPALERQRGFVARALGIGASQNQDWLATRNVEGSVAVGKLDAWGTPVRVDQAKLVWKGRAVEVQNVSAKAGAGRVAGKITVNLDKDRTRYRFEGKANGVPVLGEKKDFSGVLEAAGAPSEVPANIHVGSE